jgi:hypothetical protein
MDYLALVFTQHQCPTVFTLPLVSSFKIKRSPTRIDLEREKTTLNLCSHERKIELHEADNQVQQKNKSARKDDHVCHAISNTEN